MSAAPHTSILAFALLFALAARAPAQSPSVKEGAEPARPAAGGETEEAEESVPEKSVVRGRAVFDDTGRPARRARVTLIEQRGAVGAGATRFALTDAAGQFELKGVRAGRYLVAVFAPGALLPHAFAADDDPQPAFDYAPLRRYFDEVVVDGLTDAQVSVRARRGGAVSGHVTYAEGDPAVSASVSLFRRKGGVLARVGAAEQADDRGVFRFTGLPPGEYFVGAAETIQHGTAGEQETGLYVGSGGSDLVTTYYPGAAAAGGATPLRVELGQEKSDVNFALAERELRAVSGVLRSRRGVAVPGAQVVIRPKGTLGASPYAAALSATTTDEQGRWQLREIPDGDYQITAQAQPDVPADEVFGPAPRPPKTPREAAEDEADGEGERPSIGRYVTKTAELKLNGRDVDDLVIELEEGARVLGTIAVEGGKAAPAYVVVTAQSAAGGDAEAGGYWQGQFAVGGLARGEYRLGVNAGGEEEYYVKSITLGGRDLLREPLRVEDGQIVRGVRVVLGVGSGVIKGRVVAGAGGALPPTAYVFAVPADSARWRGGADSPPTESEYGGRFSLDAPPGDYLVFALAPARAASALTEAEIRSLAPRAVRVTLRAGQTVTVEIVLDEEK